MAHPCLGAPGDPCGEPTDQRRCPRHTIEVERPRQRRHHNRAYDDPRWRRRSKSAVASHRRRHGDVCPGWGRPAHVVAAGELTADHPVAIVKGGTHKQELGVLCRSCNGRKGAR